jgi:hypothetical protein
MCWLYVSYIFSYTNNQAFYNFNYIPLPPLKMEVEDEVLVLSLSLLYKQPPSIISIFELEIIEISDLEE